MFERIGRLAEKTADGLSRRAFLTRMGLGALTLATFVTGARASPGTSCVKNGGCCGGNYPYQYIVNGVPNACSKSPTCGPWYTRAACAATGCCNGGGYCQDGSTCYSDACRTAC